MARSQTILGRLRNKKAWVVAKEGQKCFVVMSYTTSRGGRFYADACYVGTRERWDERDKQPATKMSLGGPRYRVIVTPKPEKKT